MRGAGLIGVLVAVGALGGPSARVCADEIKVVPGPGSIAAAIAKAKPGDVLRIAAGDYTESVQLPDRVSLEGEGADKTTITPTEFSTINCTGGHNRIAGLTIKGGENTVRGVNTNGPVRIERCRFDGVAEGAALMVSPLSDVIACEFIDCRVGVRAIGGSCPTVWGCWFKGCDMGVFGVDGSSYIRNCVFQKCSQGIRLIPHQVQPAIVRNNLFIDSTKTGLEIVTRGESLFGPSIRNNVFVGGSAAMLSLRAQTTRFSHALVHGVKSPPVRTADGGETLAVGKQDLREADAGIKLSPDGTVAIANPDLVTGKGLRLSSEKPEATGTIGLEKEWRRVGIGATGTLPPPRWGGKHLIANSVGEEYQYLQFTERARGRQSLTTEGDTALDKHTPGDGKEPAEVVFDISRFFKEDSIKLDDKP